MRLVSPKRPHDELGIPNESPGTSLVFGDQLTETLALVQARNGKSSPWDGARGGRRGSFREGAGAKGPEEEHQAARAEKGREDGSNGGVFGQD